MERVNSELLKLLHLIFLTISSIVAEFHSQVQRISENIATFFNLTIFTLFKIWRQFIQNQKKVENAELVEELICSQEDFLGIHKSPREIARNVGISRISVRLVKRRKINQFKRMKTPHMNNGTRDQKAIRSGNLAERFDRNPRLVEKLAYQD